MTITEIIAGVLSIQRLDTLSKIIVSAIIVAVGGGVLFILWQTPAAQKNDSSSRPLINQQAHDVQSTGQSGGVTAGTYINQAPPVTEQQKEQSLASLKAELKELARFPERAEQTSTPTILEGYFARSTATRLYTILNKYYYDTIVSYKPLGPTLAKYQKDYYDFQRAEASAELQVFEFMGQNVGVKIAAACQIYLRYAILRTAGHTQQQIKDGGFFLNYSITWELAEECYQKIATDASVKGLLAGAIEQGNKVTHDAAAIVESLSRDDANSTNWIFESPRAWLTGDVGE